MKNKEAYKQEMCIRDRLYEIKDKFFDKVISERKNKNLSECTITCVLHAKYGILYLQVGEQLHQNEKVRIGGSLPFLTFRVV